MTFDKKIYQFPLLITALTIVVLIGIAMGITPFVWNRFFFTTPDAGGLGCGAQTLAETGTFYTNLASGISNNFSICWTKETYPLLSIAHAILLRLFPIDVALLIAITTTCAVVGTSVVMFWVGYLAKKSICVAFLAGMFTATAPAILRAAILTPQNVFGYFLLSIGLLIITLTSIRRWAIFFLIPLFPLLFFTHTLTAGIAVISISVWFWLFYIRSWKWKLALGIMGFTLLASDYFFPVLPLPIHVGMVMNLLHEHFEGYKLPLWNHPAIWGYLVTSFAAVGMVYHKTIPYLIRSYLYVFFGVVLVFGHLFVIGLTLLPDRFIAFGWLPLTLFAAVGLYEIFARLHLRAPLVTGLLIIFTAAQITHAVVFMKDDYEGWSARFQPYPEFIQAMKWLNTQPSKGTLLGVMNIINRELVFANHFYSGPVANYPWYNIDAKNLENFSAKSDLYRPVFADITNPTYLQFQKLYMLVAHPDSPAALATVQEYNIKYFVAWRRAQDGWIWQEKAPSVFHKIYKNKAYVIYDLQPTTP